MCSLCWCYYSLTENRGLCSINVSLPQNDNDTGLGYQVQRKCDETFHVSVDLSVVCCAAQCIFVSMEIYKYESTSTRNEMCFASGGWGRGGGTLQIPGLRDGPTETN
jgi:hypothetical protein